MAIRVSSKGSTNTKSTLNRIYQHKRKAIQSVCRWSVNTETSTDSFENSRLGWSNEEEVFPGLT